MRYTTIILVLVLSFSFLHGCGEDPSEKKEPEIHIKIDDALRAVANVRLPNDRAVWCEKDYKYDIIVDVRYTKQTSYSRVEVGKRYALIDLYEYDVLSIREGLFPDKTIKFFRIMILRSDVKYKLLMLRGDLTFWIKNDDGVYAVTNIEPKRRKL